MKKKVVAYLDLLGFKNYTIEDPNGAERLLNNYKGFLDWSRKRNRLKRQLLSTGVRG